MSTKTNPVLIPKQKRKEEVINPMRPKIGLPRTHTTCKLSWADYYIEYDEIERRVRVDADHNDEFVAELEANIPRPERYRCQDREVWFVHKKWKTLVAGLAKKYFDKVTLELRGF